MDAPWSRLYTHICACTLYKHKSTSSSSSCSFTTKFIETSKHKGSRKRRAIAQTAAHLIPCRSDSCPYNLSPLVFSVLAVGVKTRWVQLQCSTAGGSSGRFATCQLLLHHVIEKTCGWQLATQASHRHMYLISHTLLYGYTRTHTHKKKHLRD